MLANFSFIFSSPSNVLTLEIEKKIVVHVPCLCYRLHVRDALILYCNFSQSPVVCGSERRDIRFQWLVESIVLFISLHVHVFVD